MSATGINKVYDGTTIAMVTLGDNRLSGDVLNASDSASFGDKNVGTNKPVSVIGISISGTDAGNYSLSNTTASTTASITARPLTVSAAGVNKAYDGTTTATVTLSDNRVVNDVFTDNYANAAFADKNVGNGQDGEREWDFDLGHGRRQLHVQHYGVNHCEHHAAFTDGERDGQHQGV